MANQFLVQIDAAGERPDQIVLSVGQVTGPPLIGTVDEKRAQLDAISHASVHTLARYSVTPARVKELIKLLEGILRAFDAPATDEGAES
jgi:hypothetical protein